MDVQERSEKQNFSAWISTATLPWCPLEGTKKNIGALCWAGIPSVTKPCLPPLLFLSDITVLGRRVPCEASLCWACFLFVKKSVWEGGGAERN